ncbi:V-type ATPase subunit [Cognatishimia maritima]|uniref:Uncharacterized protein n=1 Tax=Cognatishimia maritima TaxID=870908 RepID=A0A1M5V072_9RHOB|nr:V-type ATPase subunit [Cognatishimia maritima]SHH68534.1 hypothetical protein SAMN04488044_3022 [Cognatishimia maritima]
MSDPVKNAEIEDVLSSIRRLVSEKSSVAPTQQAASAPAADENPAKHDDPLEPKDRLVLTPSLRIEEPEEAQISEEPASKVREERTSPVADTPFVHNLKQDILPLRESLPSFLRNRIHLMQSDGMTQGDDPAAADDFAFEDGHIDAAGEDLPMPSQDEDQETFKNTLPFPPPEELTFETARTSALAEETDAPDVVKTDPAEPWKQEGERLSEWQSVRSIDPESFEPDGPEDGDNAGVPTTSLDWEVDVVSHDAATEAEDIDEAEPESVEETAARDFVDQAVEDVVEADEAIDAQDYEAILDEDMLRELVGEIVRQELQGPLGERITRNVRKLVRREINRVLTAQKLGDGS